MRPLEDRRPTPGWVWMVACACAYCAMGVLVRELAVDREVSVFWIGLVRYVLSVLSMVVPAAMGAWRLNIVNRRVFVIRGVLGSMGMFLFYVAVAHVGLGRGTVLFYLMGVFGALAGMVVLKEHPSPIVWFAVLGSVAGVLLSSQAGIPRGGEWAGLGAAVLSGVTLAYIRLLRRTDTNQVTFLSQGLWGTILLLVPAVLSPVPVGWEIWAMLVAMSAFDIVGQLCMTQGLSMLPVARGASLMMLTPILSLLAGVVLFHESLSTLQWTGCGLVLAASFLAIVSRRT